MQNDYLTLRGASVVFTDTKEQLIECEAVLPDYYPEINKVLKCSVTAGTEDIAVSGDKVSVAGKADVKLTYLDAEKHVHIYTSLVKYTRVFSGLPLTGEDVCFVSQTVTSVEHRAGAPRRCEIRALAAVRLTCLRKTELSALSGTDAPDAELLTENTEVYDAGALKCFELAFSETVELPSAPGRISGVLYSSQDVEFSEVRVIRNKVMLKGCCELTARFVTDDGSLTPETAFTVPFTEIAGFPGAEEDDECRLFADAVGARVAVSEDGASAQVFVTAQVKAICVRKRELCLPADMYSVSREVSLKRVPYRIITGFSPVRKHFQVTADAECYDDTAAGIAAFFTDPPVCAPIVSGGELRIGGSVGVNFIVSCADGNLSLISRTCNFDESAGPWTDGEAFVSVSARITAASLKNGRVDYSVGIDTRGGVVETENRSVIADAVFEEGEKKPAGREKVILYYARPGEKIWDIAKENRCSADRIREFNELKSAEVEENTMLVLLR